MGEQAVLGTLPKTHESLHRRGYWLGGEADSHSSGNGGALAGVSEGGGGSGGGGSAGGGSWVSLGGGGGDGRGTALGLVGGARRTTGFDAVGGVG
jgi:hypothetical protein